MYELLLSAGGKMEWVPPAPVPGTPYQGWVSSADLIDGNTLATKLGLTIGTAHNSDAGWSHFIDGTAEFYIARKTLRYGGTSTEWLASGMQTGKTVTIGNKRFNVRFPRVFTADNWSGIVGQVTGREWKTYIQAIYGGADRPSGPQWSSFSKLDLGVAENGVPIKNGEVTIGADKFNTTAANLSATGFHYSATGGPTSRIEQCTYMGTANGNAEIGPIGNNGYGWRPMLEYIGEVIVDPDSGPGPTAIIQGDKQAGYYGTVDISEFFTGEEVDAAAATPITGAAINRSVQDLWYKFSYKGRTLFIPRVAIRSGMTWNNLYLHGLMYGTNDNGVSQSGASLNGFDVIALTPTNQMRVIQKTASDGTIFKFKVKAPSVLTEDPSNNWATAGGTDAQRAAGRASEWGQTIERTIPNAGVDSVWASTGIYSPLVSTEGWTAGGQAYFIRPTEQGGTPWGARTQSTKNPSAGYGWVPVVELIEVIKP